MTFVFVQHVATTQGAEAGAFCIAWCHNSESPPACLIRWVDAGEEADQWELEAAFRKGKCKLLYERTQLHR